MIYAAATTEDMQQAAAGELVVWAFIRHHEATLHAFPWVENPKHSKRNSAGNYVPLMPEPATALLHFPSTKLDKYLATDPSDCSEVHPWKDHYWVMNAPQTITREQIFIKSSPVVNREVVQRGMTKQQVINAFEGLHFDSDQWTAALGKNIPNWLKECRVASGKQGSKVSATWNPVLIAAALIDKKIPIKKLDAVFVHLNDWVDEWQKTSETFRD
jgi:hypothetical protein